MHKLGAIAAVLVTAVGSLGAGVAVAPPAAALDAPVAMTADDISTWQTNGIVWAMAQAQGTVFAGGTFSTVRPPGAEAGTEERPAVNFAAFDAATGEPTSCRLSFTVGSGTATVRALEVSPDGETLYAGGFFGAVNGTPVSSLAAIDIDTCTVRSSFRPSVSATVRAFAVDEDTVYLGGDFTTVADQSRDHFAAVSTAGALRPWRADVDEPARALALTPDGRNVLLGGDFFTVNGTASHALAVVDAGSGNLVKSYSAGFIPPTSVVKDITTDATGFYTGNEGTGGGVFDGRIALDLNDFEQRWRDTCLGATQSVQVYRTVLYSGSHAHDCSSMGAFPNQRRKHLLAQSVDDPTLLSWFPDTNDGLGERIGPRVMTVSTVGDTDYMWVGGEFTTVNGRPQQGLTRFASAPDTGAPSVPRVSAASTRAGEIDVRLQASLDLDDGDLSYSIFRDGATTPVWTGAARSLPWVRGQLTFTDTDVAPGSTHTYRARVTDGANTSALSSAVSVRAATVNEKYPARVLADGATLYWRYDETAGDFAADTSSGGDNGVHVGGPAYGVTPGAVPGGSRALGLDGTDQYVYSDRRHDRPAAYSVETWFRTTSTSGGKIVGFGNRTLENSTSHDKHVYMTNTGRLVFGVRSGLVRTVGTLESYNDGDWHHVVATQGSGGMRLYVDGRLRASNPFVTSHQNFAGYWRVGGDSLSGWPSRPSSDFFAGTVDETAVYPTALSADAIAAHHSLGNPPPDTTAPSAPTAPTARVSDRDVELEWTAATDNTEVTGYQVHRSASSSFTPTAATRIATVSETGHTDAGVGPGTWYYRVVAQDAAGNTGAASPAVRAVVPTVAVLTPAADTYVNGAAVTTNYGADDQLAVRGTSPYLSYLRFDLPDAPAGQVLKKAELRVSTSDDSTAGSTDSHTITAVTGDWTETGTTYADRPSLGSDDLGTLSGATDTATVYAVRVDTGALAPRLGGELSLALTSTGTDSLRLWSKEASAKDRPQLVLTFGTP